MTRGTGPWRQPVMWLVAALPASAVVASIILITLAVRSGGEDASRDPVRRTAQIQQADLGPDLQARQLGLSAVIRFEDVLIEVLPVTGDFDRDSPLQLQLGHPTRAEADVLLQLLPEGEGWRTRGSHLADHDWRVQVAASDGRWRIVGRLPVGQRAARLAPAMEPK